MGYRALNKWKLFRGLTGFALLFNSFAEKKHIGIYISIAYVLVILPPGLLLHTAGSYYITSENDFFSSYVPHAEYLLNGRFYIDVYRGPLYVLLLAFFNTAILNFLISGIIISSVSSGFFLFLIHSSLKNIFSPKLALTSVILTALNPLFIVYSYAPGTDMLFASLCAASVYFFLGFSTINKKRIALSALFAAFAFLTRYNALFLFVIPFLIVFKTSRFQPLNKKIILAFIYTGVFIVTTAPWGIYTLGKKGEYFYNENYRNMAVSFGTDNNTKWEKAWDKYAEKYDSFSDIVKEEPQLVIETLSANLVYHSYKNIFILSTLYTGVLSLIGMLFFRKSRTTARQVLFYIINAAFFVLLLPVFYDARFFLFLIPCLTIFASFGIRSISNFSRISWSIILIGIISFCLLSSISYNKPIIRGQQEIRILSVKYWEMKPDRGKKNIIASRMPHISYQLKMNWILLPAEKSVQETISELKNKKVNYIYFSRREFNERPLLRSLADPSTAPPELAPIIYIPGERVVLYSVKY